MYFASLTNILHFLIALFFPIRDHYVEYVSSKVRNSVLYAMVRKHSASGGMLVSAREVQKNTC